MDPIIEAKNVEKYFEQPDGNRIEVMAPTDLAVYPGSVVALLGPNEGKSRPENPPADYMAEGEGFEPPVPLRAQRFSRPPVSTAHATLRGEEAA